MNRLTGCVLASFTILAASSCGHSGSGPSPALPPTMTSASQHISGIPNNSPLIAEFMIPGGGNPKGITAVNQTAAWFINGHKIGRFDATTHKIVQYNSAYALGPDITPGADLALWTTGNLPGGINENNVTGNISEIVRLTESGTWSHKVLPGGGSPYGSQALTVTHGILNDVWYAICPGCDDDSSGFSGFGSVSTSLAFAHPGFIQFTDVFYYTIHSMTRGSDGNLWLFADGGSFGQIPAAIFRVVPGAGSENHHWFLPNGIAAWIAGSLNPGPNAVVWFTDPVNNAIGKITTGGTLVEYHIPTANATPWKIGLNGDGFLYFTELDANKIGRINPSTGVINEYTLPTANASPYGIVGTAGKKVYFTENNTGKIGVLTP